MWKMIWPILLVVLSNTIYHILSKSFPSESNPFLSLVITYLGAAVTVSILYLLDKNRGVFTEDFKKLSPGALLFGISLVGLEYGCISIYRAGWKISQGALVASVIHAIVLVFVGILFYQEQLTIRQIIGIASCLLGVVLISG